jgi:hypothetical protein
MKVSKETIAIDFARRAALAIFSAGAESFLNCRRPIHNQPVGVELKTSHDFPFNRSEMFWQGRVKDFSV